MQRDALPIHSCMRGESEGCRYGSALAIISVCWELQLGVAATGEESPGGLKDRHYRVRYSMTSKPSTPRPMALPFFSFGLSLGLPAQTENSESWLAASIPCQRSSESAGRYSPWRIRPSNRVAATSRPCTKPTRRNGYRVSEMRCQL